MEEANEGKRKVFFMDAAHFIFAPYIGYIWCFVRKFIKAPSGRKRYNVLGVIEAKTHRFFSVCNETYINAESVCELLRKLAEEFKSIPITIFLDNAKYQKCKLVQELADLLKIELLYLPTYSPNLNLIERMWKFVKKKCLYNTYYENFEAFKNGIDSCLKVTDTKHKTELNTLLNPRFQLFKKEQFMA